MDISHSQWLHFPQLEWILATCSQWLSFPQLEWILATLYNYTRLSLAESAGITDADGVFTVSIMLRLWLYMATILPIYGHMMCLLNIMASFWLGDALVIK